MQPTPIDIAGKVLKGGYYPLAYDAEDITLDRARALISGRFAKSQTEAGHGRGRADLMGRPLATDVTVLHRHVNHLLYDLEFSEPLANARRLLDDASLRASFSDTGRAADFDILQAWLIETGTGELRSADLIGRTVRFSKKNATAAKLATDLARALSSHTDLAETIVAAGKGDFVVALQNASQPGITSVIADRSPVMAQRQRILSKDDREDAGTPLEKMACWLAETLHYRLVEVPVWLAQYHQGLRRFGDDEGKAIAHADAYVKPAISGPLLPDAGLGKILRLFKALGSHLAAKFKAAAEATDADAAQTTQQGLSLAMDLTALAMADTVFTTVMGGRHGDATWPVFLAQHTGYSVMAVLPAIRDAENPLVGSDSDAKALANAISSPSGDLGIGHRHITDIIAATGLVAESPADEILRKIDAGLAQIARP